MEEPFIADLSTIDPGEDKELPGRLKRDRVLPGWKQKPDGPGTSGGAQGGSFHPGGDGGEYLCPWREDEPKTIEVRWLSSLIMPGEQGLVPLPMHAQGVATRSKAKLVDQYMEAEIVLE